MIFIMCCEQFHAGTSSTSFSRNVPTDVEQYDGARSAVSHSCSAEDVQEHLGEPANVLYENDVEVFTCATKHLTNAEA